MTKKIVIPVLAVMAIVVAMGAWASAADDVRDDQQAIDDLTVESYTPGLWLEEEDYAWAAESLGVEPAVIHAVVDVEAGAHHKGIIRQGEPLVAFSIDLFRRHTRKHGVNLSIYAKRYPEVFAGPDSKKYGSRQAAQFSRLRQAMAIDTVAAVYSTYWGMFQISGEYWKLCGTRSTSDFVWRMSQSERQQLELFVCFVRNMDMDQALQHRQWAQFARKYNGPAYARRGYHHKLERAYRKYAGK